MPAPGLKNIFLSVLLLTVASRAKGENDTKTVTLFDVVVPSAATGSLIEISAINVEPNGGTAYLDLVEFTETVSGSPVTTTQTETIVEAASWLFFNVQLTSSAFTDNLQQNCTLQENGTIAECVEIASATLSTFSSAATTTFSLSVVPFATITVTSPIPTRSIAATNAATSVKNPMFNRLPSFFVGILFSVMFF